MINLKDNIKINLVYFLSFILDKILNSIRPTDTKYINQKIQVKFKSDESSMS